ncbi:acyl CoA binding protein [Pycnococcus provasolii]
MDNAASATRGCPLPYPLKFEEAKRFVDTNAHIEKDFDTETRLVLYALARQAKDGPCTDPRPWAWDAVAAAKWTTYRALGDMIVPEAWRLYVKTLDEALPAWWELAEKQKLSEASGAPATENGNGHGADADVEDPVVGPCAADVVNVSAPSPALSMALAQAQPGTWVEVESAGVLPRARFEHDCAVVGTALYVAFGNAGGRCLADVHRLDLLTMTWHEIGDASSGGDQPRATAGHTLTAVGSRLVLIGGYARSNALAGNGRLEAWQLDTADASARWHRIDAGGDVPDARACHTTCRVGSRLYVYGGENTARKVLGDLHYLELANPARPRWVCVDSASGNVPPPRAGHTACSHGAGQDAEMVLFGGGTRSDVYSDVYSFRPDPPRWERLVLDGPAPEPRSGHASALVSGRYWFVAGGGNGSGGVEATRVLDLARRAWLPQAVASVAPTYVKAEGLSVATVGHTDDGSAVLLCFGGYNGRTHAKTHVLVAPLVDRSETLSPAMAGEGEKDDDVEGNLRARIAQLENELAELRQRVSASDT